MSFREDILRAASEMFCTVPEYLFDDLLSTAVLRHPNKKWYAIIMNVSLKSLKIEGEGAVDVINVKCDPALVGSLRLEAGILPAYHMNKEHWVTILLDGTVGLDTILLLLDMSYNTVGKKKR